MLGRLEVRHLAVVRVRVALLHEQVHRVAHPAAQPRVQRLHVERLLRPRAALAASATRRATCRVTRDTRRDATRRLWQGARVGVQAPTGRVGLVFASLPLGESPDDSAISGRD